MKKIRIAFYKGRGRLRDRFVRRWTKSKYSHVEIVIPDRHWWLGINPPESPRVRKNVSVGYKESEWDFIDISVSESELDLLIRFYNLTKNKGYDWIGMVLSHITPFKVKHIDKWYCSEWVLYALQYAGIINGCLAVKNEIPPSIVYDMLLQIKNLEDIPMSIENCTVH
jgi:hypothetical protein